MTACPCCSGKTYDECCEPLINGKSATTALALMRSRYTAYCTCRIEYLYNTTHSKTRIKISVRETEKWIKDNTWTKLEIINIEKGGENDCNGIVEFKAYFLDKNDGHQIHYEKSTFLKEGNKWFYLENVTK